MIFLEPEFLRRRAVQSRKFSSRFGNSIFDFNDLGVERPGCDFFGSCFKMKIRGNMNLTINKGRFAFQLTMVFYLVCALARAISAQSAQGELVGVVRDAAGGSVSGVRISATNVETSRTIETNTDTDGNFILTNLRPAVYRVEFQKTGFSNLTRENVTVSTGERIRLDAELPVASVKTTVTVSSDAPLLRSETSSLGQVIDNRKVVDLPLNGRNFLQLVGLAPGVAQPPRTAEGPSFPRINGGRPRVNEYLFDGVSVLQPEPGQIAFFPIVDAIAEFKVEINNPPAEFGRFNGGVINLTTKSGTNDFRGSIFKFFRHEALNARNLFAPTDQPKPVFRRNQLGGVIGGRIIRDKTFFFADYQGTRQSIGRIRTSTVPTLANRGGNFASSLGANIGAATVTDTNGNTIPLRVGQIFRPSDKRAYAGNIVPLADFDQAALRLLQRYPLPTAGGAANNFTRIGNEGQDQDQFDVRIDQRFTDNATVFGRYSFAKDLSVPVTPFADGSGALTGSAIGTTDTRADSLVLNYTQIFQPNLLNELRFGYTRRQVNRRSDALVGATSKFCAAFQKRRRFVIVCRR
jgi:Carboxypeptidase regulatory-like domain